MSSLSCAGRERLVDVVAGRELKQGSGCFVSPSAPFPPTWEAQPVPRSLVSSLSFPHLCLEPCKTT